MLVFVEATPNHGVAIINSYLALCMSLPDIIRSKCRAIISCRLRRTKQLVNNKVIRRRLRS